MPTFTENLNTILTGTYGNDIRKAIYDCISELKESVDLISPESLLPDAEDQSF